MKKLNGWVRVLTARSYHASRGVPRDVAGAYGFISDLRKRGLKEADRPKLERIVLESKTINNFNEMFLCLTLSLVLNPRNVYRNSLLVESLSKRILCISDLLTLQGANQVLGAFAKLKSENVSAFNEMPNTFFCQKVFDTFQSRFLATCPNRELSNVFWAASILGLQNMDETFLARNKPLESLAKSFSTFDCVDLSLVCAALIEKPESPLWPIVRTELLSRREFTPKDIPSIMCSLACAGVNDRELMLHICTVIHRTKLLEINNLPGIVWAVATADAVHFPLLERALEVIHQDGYRITDSLDLRRVSRGFAVNGYMRRIENWLIAQISKSNANKDVSDTVLIWELVTNQLFSSAVNMFKGKPLTFWKELVSNDSLTKSQMYHLYLASLIDSSLNLSAEELSFLKELENGFASVTEDLSSSVLHKNASEALRKLDYKHVSEYKEPISGYVIDMFIPDEKIGIEVQGPTHFITDLETGANILRPADAFKHDVLRKVSGMRIVQATPWNFGPKLKEKNTVLMKALLAGRPITNRTRN